MPFVIQFDESNAVVVVTHHGASSEEECLRVLELLRADAKSAGGFGLLIDVRLIEYEPSTEEIRGLGRGLSASWKGRIAMLTGTPVQYGIARQGEAFGEADGAMIEVFDDFDEAMRWLREGRLMDG